MIYNIRGTSGSGKTYVARYILQKYKGEPIVGSDYKIQGYWLPKINTRIVGRYNVMSGGCDRINTQDEIEQRIENYARQGNVLFEGMLLSGSYGRWQALSKRHPEQFIWCFLDTPLEVYIERTHNRTGRIGTGDWKNLRQKYAEGLRIQTKALAAGENVVVLPYQNAAEAFEKLLLGGLQ